MLYRRSAQVALQAAILLALEPEGCSRRVHELATALGVHTTYLIKALQSLTHAGLLRAVRGPGGGVQLSRSARNIYLFDVLSAVQPVGDRERCFLGIGQCTDLNPCAFHHIWAPVRDQLLGLMKTQTLLEFAQEARGKGLLEAAPGCGGTHPAHSKKHTQEGA